MVLWKCVLHFSSLQIWVKLLQMLLLNWWDLHLLALQMVSGTNYTNSWTILYQQTFSVHSLLITQALQLLELWDYLCTLLSFFLFHTGRDFQLDHDSDLATVNNNASNPGRCFRIIITEDSDPEPAENFTISFVVNRTQPEGVNISINQSEAVITIQENDRKSHWFQMIGVRELHVCPTSNI